MKTLLLMRHAKSSWDDLFCPDFERPLSKRGHAAAARMGEWLVENNLSPDAILLSAATRVQQTWGHVQASFSSPPTGMPLKNLYMTNPDYLLAHIRNSKKSVQTLLVINHDPTLSTLTAELSSEPLSPNCARALQKFPSGAIARFDTDGKWTTLSQSTVQFTDFVKPKDLV